MTARLPVPLQQTGTDPDAVRPKMERSQRQGRTGSWGNELQGMLRAVSGGFIFATPLLSTMFLSVVFSLSGDHFRA